MSGYTDAELRRLMEQHVGTTPQCPVDMQPRPCPTERWFDTINRPAIEEEARTVNPEGLDAERLADAEAEHEAGDNCTHQDFRRECAPLLAWRYARLRSEGTERSSATPSSSPRTPTDGAEG